MEQSKSSGSHSQYYKCIGKWTNYLFSKSEIIFKNIFYLISEFYWSDYSIFVVGLELQYSELQRFG